MKNTNLKSFLISIIALTFATSAFAQDHDNHLEHNGQAELNCEAVKEKAKALSEAHEHMSHMSHEEHMKHMEEMEQNKLDLETCEIESEESHDHHEHSEHHHENHEESE